MDYEARGPEAFEADYSSFDLFKQQEAWEAPQAHLYDRLDNCHVPFLSFDAQSEPAFTPFHEPALGPALLAPAPSKVLIPPRYPGECPLLVNSKQAKRILIQRKKRCARLLTMIDCGFKVDPKLIGSRETMSRTKDRVRQRVAHKRKRVNGLFVNKRKELQLTENPACNLSDESETHEPD